MKTNVLNKYVKFNCLNGRFPTFLHRLFYRQSSLQKDVDSRPGSLACAQRRASRRARILA